MRDKKKKTKKAVKVGDLKPAKDPEGGGLPQGSPQDLKSLLRHLQLGQDPGQTDSKRKSASWKISEKTICHVESVGVGSDS